VIFAPNRRDFDDFSEEWTNELEKTFDALWRGEFKHVSELWSILDTFYVACERFKAGMKVGEFVEMRMGIALEAAGKSLDKLKRNIEDS
jgi:hypothetical protein